MKATNFLLARMLLLGVGGAILVGRGGAAAQGKQAKELKKGTYYVQRSQVWCADVQRLLFGLSWDGRKGRWASR
jgi:hypothetical protein